jgi:hypothetical protein
MLFGTPSVPMPRTCSWVAYARFYSDLALLRRCPGLAPGCVTLLWISPEREGPRSKSAASRAKNQSRGRSDRDAPRNKSGAWKQTTYPTRSSAQEMVACSEKSPFLVDKPRGGLENRELRCSSSPDGGEGTFSRCAGLGPHSRSVRRDFLWCPVRRCCMLLCTGDVARLAGRTKRPKGA